MRILRAEAAATICLIFPNAFSWVRWNGDEIGMTNFRNWTLSFDDKIDAGIRMVADLLLV
jgi:hypothetical protein